MSKRREKTVAQIAKDKLRIETLEPRGRDRLDFHDVSVEAVNDALTTAYRHGQADIDRIATLTAQEEKAWDHAFAYHLDETNFDQDKASHKAWRDLQKEFPRLKQFTDAL